MTIVEPSLGRIAQAIPEGRREHGLSQTQLARLSGVSRRTIGRLEEGAPIHPQLLLRLAEVILVLDSYRLPPIDVDQLLEQAAREFVPVNGGRAA